MTEVFRDGTAPVARRVEDLLGRMAAEEKLAQLGGVWLESLVPGERFDADVAASVIPHGIGEVTRVGGGTGLRPAGVAALINDVQRVAVERTRLGIPVIVHEESTGGLCARDATVFPQGIGLASTWDPALVAEVASVIREQMVAVGARHTLAPVLDVARDPRWGRVEETYGEDPVLAGTMGAAYVSGIQGKDLRDGVMATGKHFLGYGLSEGGMNHAPVQLGPRELREVYAEPFSAAVRDAGLASVMNSYASVDGLPCAGSRALLTGLLRQELGFQGLVVADYFSVGLLVSHHRTAADRHQAAVQALNAGLDMELPATDCFGEPLRAALEAGEVTMETVDAAVRRVLIAKFRLGLFERPYVDAARAPAVYQTPAQRALARRAAASSVVLLKNEGVLPLPVDPGRVAVLGPGADDPRLLQGDYHYPAHPEIVYRRRGTAAAEAAAADGAGDGDGAGWSLSPGPYFTPHVTPLAAIRAEMGADAVVVHERGCAVDGRDSSGIAAAAKAALEADLAIVVVAGRSGLGPDCTVGEARDATDLDLTGVQPELVRAVAAGGTPTVVVVLSGRVHALGDVVSRAGAVLQAWPLGEEGGNGLADVLFGRVSPAGRLPVSMPRRVGQVPVHRGYRSGGGRSAFYGSYTDCPADPLFAFGHGLSYTTFSYSGLTLEAGSTADPV
ncbi:MAG TPA: glycoside hydrolase family 3 N-terminal domain-containing protein, partial [Acidimicrobiales bacterium]|nr:glycoside hydrolase family 3 N-terminal domain-containing protein [Acidimicrobiales bacterium]